MTDKKLKDEDPTNIKEEDSDSDADDARGLGKKAKSFEKKRDDEKVRWPDSDYDDSDSDDETGGIAKVAALMAAKNRKK